MRSGNVEFGAAVGEMPCHAGSGHDPVQPVFAVFASAAALSRRRRPRPDHRSRGLHPHHRQTPHPLLARLVSLALATLVTWRLNRALTFDRSGRRTGEEAMRYAAVAASAQAVSYAVFAALVVTAL